MTSDAIPQLLFFDRKGVPIQPFGSDALSIPEVFFAPSGACLGSLEECEGRCRPLLGENCD